MVNLILSMLVAHEDYYGDDLGFTRKDIDNLVKEYDIISDRTFGHVNERGVLVLWRNNYISDERFAKKMEIEYDGNFWLTFESFSDVLPSAYKFEESILDGEAEWDPGEWYDVDVEDYWYMYNEKTLKEIMKYCFKKELEIDSELMTPENTIFQNKDIYFKDQKLSKLIDDKDDLDDLKRELNYAICEAQDSANENEYYEKVAKYFEDEVGYFERRTVKINGKDRDMVFLRIDDWNRIENDLKGYYGDFEFEDERFGNLHYIMQEFDYFRFSTPNYDYLYGDIDDILLNEYTQNRLTW